jgi:hypothetical protein
MVWRESTSSQLIHAETNSSLFSHRRISLGEGRRLLAALAPHLRPLITADIHSQQLEAEQDLQPD